MKLMPRHRKWVYSLLLLAVWFALMFSPVGEFLAGCTIFGLIVTLFICGCIRVPRDGDP